MAAKASATVMVLAAALAVLLLASSAAPVASAARADPAAAAVVPDGRHQVRAFRVLACDLLLDPRQYTFRSNEASL
jgi:hypothetical protein